ncbi:hypothetical protein [Actinospica robiniae]|uniref:hypothetical protein n=1 Tax=Actinospica robiniae TaxID=304901 RepID=UPI0003FF101E|nr:hypothetical protein [Actinospica robiniae]
MLKWADEHPIRILVLLELVVAVAGIVGIYAAPLSDMGDVVAVAAMLNLAMSLAFIARRHRRNAG